MLRKCSGSFFHSCFASSFLPVQGDREFYAEVGLLTRLHHPNLARIMGMCNEGGQKLSVFEFMPRVDRGMQLEGQRAQAGG